MNIRVSCVTHVNILHRKVPFAAEPGVKQAGSDYLKKHLFSIQYIYTQYFSRRHKYFSYLYYCFWLSLNDPLLQTKVLD